MPRDNTIDITVHGRNAVDALAAFHPERVQRLFFSQEQAPRFSALCKKLALEKKIYRLVEIHELDRIAGSPHHGGCAAVCRVPFPQPPQPRDIGTWLAEDLPVLVLDGVGNSHNLGAIARTAAFLGLKNIVLKRPAPGTDSLITGSAWRTAEGGMEHLRLHMVEDLEQWVKKTAWNQAAGGLLFIAADHRAAMDLRELPAAMIKKTGRSLKKLVPALVLGNEETGLDPKVARACHLAAKISGTGRIESLNVAQAAVLFLWTLTAWRSTSAT